MKSFSEETTPITGINVTPLVDIILVVLIIFMATAPLIHRRAINVEVPEAKHQEQAEEKSLEISYSRAGKLHIQGQTVSRRQLERALKAVYETIPEVRVLLAADRDIPYGEIISLLDLIRSSGLRKVNLEVKSAR